MLATSCYIDYSMPNYFPHVSSPLSPRSANIHGRYPASTVFMVDAESAENQKHSQRGDADKTPFNKRAVKKAPTPSSDELKERRRSAFLKKVKDDREDRRFERRGDDIMRQDFMQSQRQWEAARLREAPTLPLDDIEYEEDDPELPSADSAMLISVPASQALPVDDVDDLLRQEEEEMQALVASMPHDEPTHHAPSEHPWSDDDYDALFSEIVEQFEGTDQQENSMRPLQDEGDSMDLS